MPIVFIVIVVPHLTSFPFYLHFSFCDVANKTSAEPKGDSLVEIRELTLPRYTTKDKLHSH